MKNFKILALIGAFVVALLATFAPSVASANSTTVKSVAPAAAHPFVGTLASPGPAFVAPMWTDALGCQSFGGKIYNNPSSVWGIALGTGCSNNGVPPGHWSNEYLNSRDVDKFYVGTYAVCADTDRGTHYGQGWWQLYSDTTYIRLYCYRQAAG